MFPPDYPDEGQPSATPAGTRRKTVAACERCREKRIKCNGMQPCIQCERKQAQCIFTTGPSNTMGTEVIAEKLDLVLSRLDRVERNTNRLMFSRRSHGQGALKLAIVAELAQLTGQLDNGDRALPGNKRPRGLAQLNRQTRCLEYYGNTSAFVAASSLIERVRQLEDDLEPPNGRKKRRIEDAVTADHLESLGLDEVPGFCDYIAPPNSIRLDRSLRISTADRHLDNFFSTIHVFIPIFDQADFRARYQTLRSLFGDRRLAVSTLEDPSRPQFVCLLYAVLALGALYEYGSESSSLWASWYFAEAQDMLGRLLDATNMHLVQAALLLGAYAQHAIKPNLAYILTGTATRLAFSIGLNIESLHKSLPYNIEESRRTYWMIYAQEVELSLDSGRPISLPSSQMGVEYPTSQIAVAQLSPTVFIQYLAKMAKILGKILDLIGSLEEQQYSTEVDDFESLRQELLRWREDLPPHLQLEDEVESNGTAADLSHWGRRQQSSLRIHFNLGIIILLRGSLKRSASKSVVGDPEMLSLHQSSCLDAARDMIRHIAALFRLAPHLRAWSYYCFYCLQATLVLLPKLAGENHLSRISRRAMDGDDRLHRLPESDWDVCNLAVKVFEQIELKASQRCAEVVKQFLNKCVDKWKRAVKPVESPSSMGSKSTARLETQPLWNRIKPQRAGLVDSADNMPSIKDSRSALAGEEQGLRAEDGTPPGLDGGGGAGVARTSPSSLNELCNDLYGAFYSHNGTENPGALGHLYPFDEGHGFMNNAAEDTGIDWDWASIMGLESGSM